MNVEIMKQDIKFKDIKKYCSRIDRISICSYETMGYENYDRISMVPKKYDDKFLYGFGLVESEFGNEVCNCIEFCLSDVPKEKHIKEQNRKERKN